MVKIRHFFSLLLLWSVGAWGQNAVVMPHTEGSIVQENISDTRTFQGPAAEIDNEYSRSQVVFTPRTGEVIKITLSNLSIQSSEALLYFFDGGLSSTYSNDGLRVAFDKSTQNIEIYSTATDGKMTVRLMSLDYEVKPSWSGTVSSIPRPDVPEVDATSDIRMHHNDTIYRISSMVNFYDNGGEAGNRNMESIYKTVLKPSQANGKVKITFTNINFANTGWGPSDDIKIYAGSVTDNSALLATVSSSQSTPISYTSTAETGELTVVYSTKGYSAAGFKATVEQELAEVPETPRDTIYLFKGNDTVNVVGSIMFYDEGGRHGNYQSTTDGGASGAVTFVPEEGKIIKMKFHKVYNGQTQTTYHTYTGADDLIFYNGYSTNPADKLLSVYGAKSNLSDLLSSSEDGAITVQFNPNKNLYGWAIEVISYEPTPLAISSIKSTAITSDSVLKGSTANQMLLVKVDVGGEYGSLDIKEFAIQAEAHYLGGFTGTMRTLDIISRTVYATDTISRFAAANEFGKYNYSVCDDSIYRITGNYTITKPGTYKFWIAYNIKTDAIVGNKIKAQLLSVVADGDSITTLAQSETAVRAIKAGMSGIYTIGSSTSADFPTFTAAITAIKGGISGNVTFNVESGTYDEMILIPEIPGASDYNKITFQSQSGNYQDVIVHKSGYLTRPSGFGSYDDYGTITINGADYLTLKNISVKATSNQAKSVVLVTNVSEHFTMDGCYVEAPKSSSYSTQVHCLQIKGKNEAYQNCDYSVVKNSIFKGGYAGVYVYGTGYVALPKQKGAVVYNNKFSEQDYFGIYMTKEHNAKIYDNTIKISGTINTGYKAIDAVMIGNIQIYNNRIHLDSTATNYAYGIYTRRRDDNETLQGRNKIYNNEIIFDNPRSVSSTPIYFSDPLTNTEFVYNSILVKQSNPAIKNSLVYLKTYASGKTNENVNFVNNLFQNFTEGVVYQVQNESYLTPQISFHHNGYFTQGTAIASNGGSPVADLDAWQAIVGDSASVFAQAVFYSDQSLNLDNGDIFKIGANRQDITYTDINGIRRHTQTPTIGAYEFSLQMDSIPDFTNGYPRIVDITKNSAKVLIKLSGNGNLQYLIRKSSQPAPTLVEMNQVLTNIRQNTEISIDFTGLESETEYIVYFIRYINSSDYSAVTGTAPFSTLGVPTEVSTFENVETSEGVFTDGTADFSGFRVVEIADGQGPNNLKAAKIESDTATIAINNSTKGLILNGFYLKSDSQITLKAMRNTVEKSTKTLSQTEGKWHFINLRDMDTITAIKLIATAGSQVMIDNFSGEPQPITFMIEDTTVNYGNPVTIHTDIYGGVLPYTYAWKNSKNEIVSTLDSMSIASVSGANQYTLTVTDAWGSHYTQAFLVSAIGGTAEIATFENLYLEPESYWWGDSDNEEMYSTFYSGSYSFSNVLMEEYDTWALFGYTNKTSTSYNPTNMLSDQFNSLVGHGVDNSQNYAVVYTAAFMGKTEITLTHAPQGDSIKGFYATNTAWVKYVSENGCGLNSNEKQDANEPFTTGDFLKLTAKGDNGKIVEYYLVDYRDTLNSANHYLLDSWQWIDLSPLGKVKSVEFSMDGSRQTNYGTNIPTYFCMDNFGASRPISTGEELILTLGKDSVITLQDIFGNSIPNGADSYYEITDSLDRDIAISSLNGGMLTLQPQSVGETHLILSQKVKGETRFMQLPIKVEQPTNTDLAIEKTRIFAYPNPTTDGFSLNASGKVEIFSLNGQKLYLNQHYTAGDKISTSHFEQGSYLVRIGNEVLKLIVK